jgi:hypothetical protein
VPHVTLHFDPSKVEQETVDLLKKALQQIVADALNVSNCEGSQAHTKVEDIYVRQAPAHPTDVNPAAIEIEVQAGRKRDRSEIKVTTSIEEAVYQTGIIPESLLEGRDCCLWLRFSEDNDFRVFSGKKTRAAVGFHDVHP